MIPDKKQFNSKLRECVLSANRSKFLKTSTIHGLPHIADASSFPELVFWIVATVGVSLTAVVMLFQTLDAYLIAPTSTSVKIKAFHNVTLPNITVCVPHLVVKSKLQLYLDENPQMNDSIFLEYLHVPFIEMADGMTPLGRLESFIQHSNNGSRKKNYDDHYDVKFQDLFEQLFGTTAKYLQFFEQVTADCSDLLLVKVFQSTFYHPCNSTKRFLANTGVCFFDTVPAIASDFHELSALFLHFNYNTDDYYRSAVGIHFEKGLRIYFDPYDALVNRDPVIVPMDTKTKVSLRFEEYNWLPKYFKCRPNIWPADTAATMRRQNQTKCTIMGIETFCKCAPLQTLMNVGSICSPAEFIDCMKTAHSFDGITGVCREQNEKFCRQVFIHRDVSTIAAVSNDELGQMGYNGLSTISIRYESSEYRSFDQSVVISGQQVLSDIGGQLGLWLGSSMISVLHLVISLTKCVFRKLSTMWNSKNTDIG